MKKLLSVLLLLFLFPLLSFASNLLPLSHTISSDSVVLQAKTGLPGEMLLSWTSTNPLLSYQIERSFNGTDFIPLAMVSAGSSSAYLDNNLYYYTLYWYRISAHNPITGENVFSNVLPALSKAGLPNPYPVFQDTFDAKVMQPAWKVINGKWMQKNGMLQQTDTTQIIYDKKVTLSNKQFPDTQMILAKIKVTQWSKNGLGRAGVGLNTNPQGNGNQFLFHGDNQVAFLADGRAWSNSISFPWSVNTWYWVRFLSQPNTNQLFAKVWQDGTPEPSNWMFQQNNWSFYSGGVPALGGGGAESTTTYATASFDSVQVFGSITNSGPFILKGDKVNPDQVQITTFATGLNYPHSMQELADGSLLVSTSDPLAQNGNYFASTGVLLRFVDLNQDGAADGPGQVMYSGLPGTLSGLQAIDDLIFVTSSQKQNEAIFILRQGANASDPYTLIGSINFTFPTQAWSHRTYALLVKRVSGKGPGRYQLFFNVGSQFNNKADIQSVNLSGLIAATVQGSSIYSIDIQDTGTDVVLTNLTQIAKGLRNAAGIAFDPRLGDLYINDNSMDLPTNQDEPLSTDVLYHISADQIGKKIFDFGFPNSYISYRSGIQVGQPTELALVAFQPTPDSYAGSESEGISEIAFSPTIFPSSLNNGIFAGFHGRFNLGGFANEENPLVFYDRTTGDYFHIIGNNEPNIGHLDGLLSTCSSLYISDLSSVGDLMSDAGTGKGVIYKIQTTLPVAKDICRRERA